MTTNESYLSSGELRLLVEVVMEGGASGGGAALFGAVAVWITIAGPTAPAMAPKTRDEGEAPLPLPGGSAELGASW